MHNIDTMFYTRETPWHGLGTKVGEAPTSEDALHLAELDWRVYQTPAVAVINGEMRNTGSFVNVRDKDDKILGIVSGQYKIVQNKEAFAFTDEIVGGDVRYETAGSILDGKMVWLLARLPETNVLGDRFANYFLFSNSHNGTAAVRATITPVRVVCQNTLNIALKGAKRTWSFVHKGNIFNHLQEAKQTLEMAKSYQDEFAKTAERLAVKRYTGEEVKRIIDRLFPIEDGETLTERRLQNMIRQREQFERALDADDVQNFRGTAWGLLNAISDYAFHAQPIRETRTFRENKIRQVIEGNNILDRAFQMIA